MDILLLIFIGTLSRFAPHPANVTAVGALAVFSGSRYGKYKGLFILVATMLISDVILGFHAVMWAIYGSLAFGVFLSSKFIHRPSIFRIGAVTLASSIIFYLVTNFAVWVIPGSMYPKTTAGLIDSYIMALPFFRNSLVGDFFYTGVFFGGAEIVAIVLKKIYAYRYHKARQ
jgi:hypothetical protein